MAKMLFEESDWTPGMFLLLGMNFQTGCLFLVISRIRWTYNVISLWMLQSYIWIRAMDYENNPMIQKPALITLVVYLIIFPYFCYAGEKEDRRVFMNAEILQEHLRGYEELIKNVIPSSILIVKEGHITFFNKTTRDIFNIRNEEELLDILGNLQVKAL